MSLAFQPQTSPKTMENPGCYGPRPLLREWHMYSILKDLWQYMSLAFQPQTSPKTTKKPCCYGPRPLLREWHMHTILKELWQYMPLAFQPQTSPKTVENTCCHGPRSLLGYGDHTCKTFQHASACLWIHVLLHTNEKRLIFEIYMFVAQVDSLWNRTIASGAGWQYSYTHVAQVENLMWRRSIS